MIIAKSASDGLRLQRRHQNFQGFLTPYIGSQSTVSYPQAFLVEQEAGFKLRPHFHLQHQFQVVLSGTGTLGRHDLTPWVVHYSSPESGYGPITAGPHGLAYMTLRASTNWTTGFLPEDRGEMREGLAKTQFTLGPVKPSGTEELRALSIPQVAVLHKPDQGGLAVWFVRVPSNTTAHVGRHPDAGGRYHLVVAGTLALNGAPYARGAVVFASPEEELPLTAGNEGLELMVLQFPKEAVTQPIEDPPARLQLALN